VESKALNHPFGDSFVGNASRVSSNQHLRNSVQSIFESPALQLADGLPSARAEIRLSLRQLCADARESGLRAEQLLVLLKDVWSELPATIVRTPSIHGDERLNYVITTCVDEYYGHIPFSDEGAP
jgi:hypothetical protein